MRTAIARLLAGGAVGCALALAIPAPAVIASPAAPANPAECANLTTLTLPDAKVTEAAAVPAAATGTVRVPHCRVAGVIGKEIRFSLLMPDEWNRKFLMGGGGGFVGTVQNQAQSVVNAGYATVGHRHGTSGQHHQSRLGAEQSRAAGELRLPRGASHRGSREGDHPQLLRVERDAFVFLGLLERRPSGADGGAALPGGLRRHCRRRAGRRLHRRSGRSSSRTCARRFRTRATIATPPFSPETLKSIETQIVDKCDAIDGVKDGLMDDPRTCKVDVAALSGVTDAQRTMLKAIYAETRNKDGVIYPAQPVGGEGEAAGWRAWITGLSPTLMTAQNAPSIRYAFGTEMFKYFVFGDPSFDYTRYDLSTYKKDTARAAAILNATDPNLDAFKKRRRQAAAVARLVRSGAHRRSAASSTTSRSRRAIAKARRLLQDVPDARRAALRRRARSRHRRLGGDDRRMGGEGQGARARDRARSGVAGAVARTRPLCAYPQRAVYTGSGSIDDAANFTCRQP